MSNVLIGIIGVIPFIGLALAGALFLGPRFQQSTQDSKASAAVQAVSQVAAAANMQNMEGGSTVMSATNANSLVGTYLKAVPNNPTNGNPPLLSEGFAEPNAAGAAAATYVVMPVITKEVCAAIARQSGQTLGANDAPPEPATLPTTPSGCYRTTVDGHWSTGYQQQQYLAFARI